MNIYKYMYVMAICLSHIHCNFALIEGGNNGIFKGVSKQIENLHLFEQKI